MDENKITTYISEDEIERNNVKIEKSKRKRSKKKFGFFKLIFTLVFVGLVVYGGYKAYPYIKKFISLTPNESENNNENIDTPPNENQNNNEENSNNTENNSPSNEPTAPMDGYSIVENSSNYFFNNESQVDFNPSGDFSPIKASEIYSKYGGDSPLVLITHFSNREAYSNGKSYSVNDNFYSDTSNVGDIGEIFSSELNRLGINTIHLNETYASGSIYNSRSEYEKSLKAALTQFPSITYVINISRDISINKDMSMIKSVISHNEKSLAQLSFISGTNLDSMTDNQIKNADFAASLSAFANESINRFIKQNTVSQFSLSQDYSTFCLEIEFGSYANSFDEAVNSAYCFADLLSEYLTN